MTLLQLIGLAILPVLLAITVHEVAHGWVALRYGDTTARSLGRLTLNPLRHIDPVGTVLVPGVLLAMSSALGTGLVFGWAKPVPVNMRNLRNPRRDMAIVAVAGPLANLAMAIAWALLIHLGLWLGGPWPWLGQTLVLMGEIGILVNLFLLVLNLLPIPPLDGGRVLLGILPLPLARPLYRLEPYGLFLLIGLLFAGLLDGLAKVVLRLFNLLQQVFLLP